MKHKLKKELGLFDVFAISTGAMFSSGFFLLPGLASQLTGPSVFLAYLLSGILIVPAMFSIAEIATALPRSGGAYYFLDRGLGPLMGTIGGLGTYFALMFKTAFAIIGIGAYAAIFWNIPVKTVAIIATFGFMALNLVGAKKTSRLQNVFVTFLLIVLTGFIVDGLVNVFQLQSSNENYIAEHLTPLFTNGFDGLIATVGFVFVSYMGLTQIASVAEEIKNPERNIPLGMTLSLIVTGLIYVLGVYVMVAVIDPADFGNDMAPAATAVTKLFTWIPGDIAAYLMIGAAMAAFASTGNAGLLSSSRYPFAMSRDKLFPRWFAKIGKKGTPVYAILLTTAFILIFILTLSEKGIVKMASTFQLLIFLLINFSVIVFRKSGIESYDPGYRSPFYPYMQIIGIIVSFVLIIYMGWMPILLTCAVLLIGYLWYHYQAREKVEREGAIFHWFARLGKYRYSDIENEFMTILKEKGLRSGDPFDETIIHSQIFHITKPTSYEDLVKQVSERCATEMHLSPKKFKKAFLKSSDFENSLVLPGISIMHARHDAIDFPRLQIVIAPEGIQKPVMKNNIDSTDSIQVFFFLVNPGHDPKQQLRMLSRLIDLVEKENFASELIKLKSHREIKEYLLQAERYLSVQLLRDTKQFSLVGQPLKVIKLPSDVLVALVERHGETFAPHGNTVLEEGDVLTMFGDTKSIAMLFKEYLAE